MAETVEIQTGLRENTAGLVEEFAGIVGVDPVSAALLLVGALLVFFSAGFFGALTLGAVGASIRRMLSSPRVRPR